MSTATATAPFQLTPEGYYVPTGHEPFAAFKKNRNGTGTIEGLKIFKSGTFRDSMGYQRTWEVEHLEQMVFHFGMLRDRGIFPNVPVRDGHPSIFGSGGQVVGYINSLERADEFLTANLDITEPEALAKWERGTFRARSLEVGMYETNDETAYWPVVMGLAFVDIPAVEGLYSKYSNPSRRPERSKFHFAQTLVDDKENTVGNENQNQNGGGEQQPQGQPAATPPAPPAQPSNPQTAPADAGNGVETTTTAPDGTTVETAPASPDTEQGTAPNPPAQQAQHAAGGGAFTFTIGGRQTTDFAAVQAHVAALEGFQRETMENARKEFVKGLASHNKIAATQIDSLTAHALGLNDQQWDAFRAAYEAAPQVPLFGQHANGGTGEPAPAATDAVADEIAVLEKRIAMHRRAGMSEENIQNTESFKRLQALQPSGTAAK